MNINYEYYRIFYYVAKYKNLTTTAEVLHSNQPNVSRVIKLLEHETGCPLLIRSNRGIALTPEGEQLYSHVKIAVEQFQLAEDELNLITNLQKGSVTVGVSETALRLILLPVLKEFKKKYPDIQIHIQNHLAAQAIDSVKNNTVDFAVVVPFGEIAKSFHTSPLMEFNDILIGGTAYSEFAKTSHSLSAIASQPLICLNEHTMTFQFYEQFFRSHGLSLKPEFTVAATDQILPIVKNNLGLGFIPKVFVEDTLSMGEVCQIPLKESIPARKVFLVENKERPLPLAAEALKTLLIQYTKIGQVNSNFPF